jgi:hypothetical protein
MKERVQIKHDTSENWAKASKFIPLAGELIIYDGIIEDGCYLEKPRIKIGDGIHKLNELPFLNLNAENTTIEYDCDEKQLKFN